MKLRRELAEHFNYPDGEDVGGHTSSPVPLLPACLRFDGNLYRKVDRAVWERLRGCVGAEVLVVSALYGLLSPREAIRDYRPTMNDLFAPGLRLGRWWSERGLGSLLAEYVERSRAAVVHDFLSGSYARIARQLPSLAPTLKVERHTYPGLGSGADYHRGAEVRHLIEEHCFRGS